MTNFIYMSKRTEHNCFPVFELEKTYVRSIKQYTRIYRLQLKNKWYTMKLKSGNCYKCIDSFWYVMFPLSRIAIEMSNRSNRIHTINFTNRTYNQINKYLPRLWNERYFTKAIVTITIVLNIIIITNYAK